jgi:hypothetical protein
MTIGKLPRNPLNHTSRVDINYTIPSEVQSKEDNPHSIPVTWAELTGNILLMR